MFPPRVARLFREEFAGKRTCHLFGGFSTFGVRLDIDPATKPHVFGDAWLPPFVRDAFDVVILDPPYIGINQQMKQQLLRGASWIAREHVVWFHTQWIAAGTTSCVFDRAWLVRVGDSCAVRCIQVFRTSATKTNGKPFFTRGPAIRYNRWLAGQTGLPFRDGSTGVDVDAWPAGGNGQAPSQRAKDVSSSSSSGSDRSTSHSPPSPTRDPGGDL